MSKEMRILSRLCEMRSDSDIAFNRIDKWLNECCSSDHPYCVTTQTDPVLPRRVLDISASQGRVVLCEHKGQRARYITLSLEGDGRQSKQKVRMVAEEDNSPDDV